MTTDLLDGLKVIAVISGSIIALGPVFFLILTLKTINPLLRMHNVTT